MGLLHVTVEKPVKTCSPECITMAVILHNACLHCILDDIASFQVCWDVPVIHHPLFIICTCCPNFYLYDDRNQIPVVNSSGVDGLKT